MIEAFPLLLLLAACGPSDPGAAAGSDTVLLVYQSRVDGEIEPCG